MSAGRLAVVTGGSRGIGRACAAALLRQGCRVLITGRDAGALADAEAELSRLGEVRAISLDVTDLPAVERVLSAEEVDILVANAGTDLSARFQRTTIDDWHRLLEVNATSVFACAQAVLPRMLQAGFGRVVVVASIAGRAGLKYGAAYTASKHAAVGLVRALALEVAGSGTTVNAICPGFVETDMADRVAQRIVAATGRTADEAKEVLRQQSPLGRMVAPEECAAAVAYLASDAAAAVNGQALVIDGGALQR